MVLRGKLPALGFCQPLSAMAHVAMHAVRASNFVKTARQPKQINLKKTGFLRYTKSRIWWQVFEG